MQLACWLQDCPNQYAAVRSFLSVPAIFGPRRTQYISVKGAFGASCLLHFIYLLALEITALTSWYAWTAMRQLWCCDVWYLWDGILHILQLQVIQFEHLLMFHFVWKKVMSKKMDCSTLILTLKLSLERQHHGFSFPSFINHTIIVLDSCFLCLNSLQNIVEVARDKQQQIKIQSKIYTATNSKNRWNGFTKALGLCLFPFLHHPF